MIPFTEKGVLEHIRMLYPISDKEMGGIGPIIHRLINGDLIKRVRHSTDDGTFYRLTYQGGEYLRALKGLPPSDDIKVGVSGQPAASQQPRAIYNPAPPKPNPYLEEALF